MKILLTNEKTKKYDKIDLKDNEFLSCFGDEIRIKEVNDDEGKIIKRKSIKSLNGVFIHKDMCQVFYE